MSKSDFIEFVLQHLAPLGGVRARAMFGGHGIYKGDIFFAIVVEEGLYFKADEQTRSEFTEKGLSPFSYEARGKTMTMQYYEAPPEVFEQSEEMVRWARLAIGAAMRAKEKKKAPKKPARR